jgi:hypothetical protein
VVSGSPKA